MCHTTCLLLVVMMITIVILLEISVKIPGVLKPRWSNKDLYFIGSIIYFFTLLRKILEGMTWKLGMIWIPQATPNCVLCIPIPYYIFKIAMSTMTFLDTIRNDLFLFWLFRKFVGFIIFAVENKSVGQETFCVS